MPTEIVINANSLETRVALLENRLVTEFYIERSRDRGSRGNVYKGKVINVLPGMQAAFVDIGLERAGFLYVSDVDISSHLENHEELMKEVALEEVEKDEQEPLYNFKGRSRNWSQYVSIEDMLQMEQEILVQVSKEPLGTKGPRLTSYLTLPGRYLVFTSTIDQIGISRRIEKGEERKRLKELIEQIKEPGIGYIVRTASEGKGLEEFSQDMVYLNKLWCNIQEKSEKAGAPCLIHQELDLILRTIRDLFTIDVDRLVIDSPAEYENCLEFVRSFLPHLESRIELYTGREPIFDAFEIEMEINRSLDRKIWLRSGGYIVIEQTEALCTIDVNTGRFVGERNPEETVLKTNLEAIKEIVYQVRLRNIGGLIIIDFIDMEKEESKEKLFQTLEEALKRDRSKTNILKISELGLVEMTRQRVRESLGRKLCQPCPYCDGQGNIKSATTVCYEVFREIQRASNASLGSNKVLVTVHPEVADLLLEEKEAAYLEQLEMVIQKKIVIQVDKNLHLEHFEVVVPAI